MRTRLPAVFLCSWLASATAAAQTSPPTAPETEADDRTERALALMREATELYHAARYAEALERAQQSNELVPSPNSALVAARCLERVGRLPEALEAYRRVHDDAAARAASEARYQPTADAAASEGAALRGKVAAIRVTLSGAAPDATVEIGGRPATRAGDEASGFAAPGDVPVLVRSGAREERRTVRAAAGEEVLVSIALGAPPPDEPPPGERPRWPLIGAVAAGGVAVVATGFFIGFGARSQGIYDDLYESCGSTKSCGVVERAQADEGETAGAVANGALAVAIVTAAVAGTFAIVYFTSEPSAETALELGPGGAALRGRF